MRWRLRTVAVVFTVALIACVVLGSLAETPGAWSVRASDIDIPVSRMQVMRGEAIRTGDEIVVIRGDARGIAVVSIVSDFASTDYPRVVWLAVGIPDRVSVSLLWGTDLEPSRLNSTPVDIRGGHAMPVNVIDQPHWIGHITGVALAFQGDLRSPIRVRRLFVRAGGLAATLSGVARAWTSFAPWSMTSADSLEAHDTMSDVSPVALLLASLGIALMLLVGAASLWEKPAFTASFASLVSTLVPTLIVLTLLAWLVLDVGWTAGLAGHVRDDDLRFAGKTSAAKHLALDDGALYAFVEKARTILPPVTSGASVTSDVPAARVFVVADSNYLRGQAAYLFYPWNVWTDRAQNVLPPTDQLRTGDWLVVYQRRGVEYDAAKHHLRWDGGKVLDADLKLLDHGGALFELR